MSQSFECTACGVRWDPFMTTDGACPQCNGGTRRVQGPASAEAQALHQAALAARIERERSEHNHKLFEDFYRDRQIRLDGERLAAQATTPIPVDAIRRGLALRDDAYLRCVGCGWSFPIATTDERERCSQCDGELAIALGADDDVQHGEQDVAA